MTERIRREIARLVAWNRVKNFNDRMDLQAQVVRNLTYLYHNDLEATQDIAPVFAELVDPIRGGRQ